MKLTFHLAYQIQYTNHCLPHFRYVHFMIYCVNPVRQESLRRIVG